jgi:hypothetical protein
MPVDSNHDIAFHIVFDFVCIADYALGYFPLLMDIFVNGSAPYNVKGAEFYCEMNDLYETFCHI